MIYDTIPGEVIDNSGLLYFYYFCIFGVFINELRLYYEGGSSIIHLD